MKRKTRILSLPSIIRFGLIGIAAITFFLPCIAHAEVYQFVSKWGSLGSTDGNFSYPRGVAVDSSGNVYVADTANNRIQKLNSTGSFLLKWAATQVPSVAVDASGYVYVADTNNSLIRKFNSSGTSITQWGGSGSGDGQFNSPCGIAVDTSGNVYVADQANHRIQKFTSAGAFITSWGTLGTGDAQFNSPQGVAVDSSGNVYAADTNNSRIQKFDSSGNFIIKWGSAGAADGQFGSPSGVAVDSSGKVYVADTNNSRIQKFGSSGNFITKWGSAGAADGQLSSPSGVAVDSSGNVYVADTTNHRIQKFKPIFSLYVDKAGTGAAARSVGVNTGTLTWNGNIGSASYDGGTSVTIFAYSSAYTTLIGWLGGGCSGTYQCTTTLNGDTFVRAVYSGQTESVWAWGRNIYGTLGNGTNTDSNTPVQVSGLSNIRAVAGGGDHTIALKSDGSVWTWGKNNAGQLGNGTNTDSNTPVPVSGLENVIAVAGGLLHTIALKSDGTVWAWGFNGNGQLGNVTNTTSNTPVQVSGLGNVIAVAGGGYHTVALKTDGTVWAWGANGSGTLGNGTNTDSNTPVQVSGLGNICAVAGGYNYTIALKADGTVWAWGRNDFGQLGNGTNTDSNTPVQVSGLSNVRAVAGDTYHTITLKLDGTVWTWGNNYYGQLGNGTNTNSNTPVQVSGLGNVIAVAMGSSYTIALKSDGTVWTWGWNDYSQLGNGTNINSNTPVRVSNLGNVIAVAGGYLHTIAPKWVNYSLTAQKAGSGNGTVTSSPAGITCGVDCSENYNIGAYVTLSAGPDSESVFNGWSGEGCSGTGSCNITYMDTAKTVTATFTDTKVPTGSILINGGANLTNSLNVNLTLGCTDASSGCAWMKFSNDGTTWSDPPDAYSAMKDWPLLAGDGPKAVSVQFKDAAGNWSNPYSAMITLDQTAPAATISGTPASRTNTTSANLTIGGADVVAYKYKIDGGNYGPETSVATPINLSGLAEGSHTVSVIGRDLAWNWQAEGLATTVTWTVDITPPTAIINGTPPSPTSATSATLTVGGIDMVAYKYTVDSGAYSSTEIPVATPIALTSLADGSHTVSVIGRDMAWNWQEAGSATTASWTVDAAKPTGTVSINSGALGTNSTSVTLSFTVSDGGGTGVVQVGISNDGNNYEWRTFPLMDNTWTLPAGVGVKTVYVKFRDAVGNESATPYSKTITLDTTNPVPVINQPLDSAVLTSRLNAISGAVTDASPSGGLSEIVLQVAGGGYYLTTNPSAPWVSTLTFFTPSDGTVASWSHNTSGVNLDSETTYTITARATDQAGNVGTASSQFSYCLIQFSADLSMDISSQRILSGGTVSVAGKLTRLPDNGKSLKDLPIKLTITDRDGVPRTIDGTAYDNGMTYNDAGHYIFENVSGFTNDKGPYTLRAEFVPRGCLLGKTSLAKSILVGRSAGYAILVEGKITNSEGLDSHNRTANRIYQKLLDRGFEHDNIYYFNYDTSQTGVVVDALPTKSGIQNAITTWAKKKMNSSEGGQAAPLYIIMVDHGMQGGFYLYDPSISPYDTTISPQELASWLNTLEGGLNADALLEKRVVIIGACYSGSFISALSRTKSDTDGGRVIITSAATDEESYKGLMEDDGVRSGEYFLDEFFIQLGRGYSFKKSFDEAAAKTREFTRKGGSTNALNKYLDTSVQHPLLDDNGDGKGSNLLSLAMGDGPFSRAFFLGTGPTYDTNAAENPAEVVKVTETLYRDTNTTSATLWLDANVDVNKIGTAGLMIRPPSVELTGRGTAGSDQLFIDLPTHFLYNRSAYRWDITMNNYFTDPKGGLYEVFYFVKDLGTGEISPLKKSLVYKDKVGNNYPEVPILDSPANWEEDTKTVLVFRWHSPPSKPPDPDGDTVTYNLVIKDSNGNVVYRKEGISTTMTYVDGSAGLVDGATYSWQIEAVDAYGKIALSAVRYFIPINKNYIPGILQGIVYSDQSAAMIAGATVKATIGEFTTTMSALLDGNYALEVSPGDTVRIECTKSGYQTASVTNVVVSSGEITTFNIPLSVSAGPGDLNGDTKVDLADAILAMKAVSGAHLSTIPTIYKEADVNNDGKIGLADVIYILQKIAELRQQ